MRHEGLRYLTTAPSPRARMHRSWQIFKRAGSAGVRSACRHIAGKHTPAPPIASRHGSEPSGFQRGEPCRRLRDLPVNEMAGTAMVIELKSECPGQDSNLRPTV